MAEALEVAIARFHERDRTGSGVVGSEQPRNRFTDGKNGLDEGWSFGSEWLNRSASRYATNWAPLQT